MVLDVDPAFLDPQFVLRRFATRAPDMVYVRGVIEASEGIGIPFSMAGGEVTIATFAPRAAELDALLEDLRIELGDNWLWGPIDVSPTR